MKSGRCIATLTRIRSDIMLKKLNFKVILRVVGFLFILTLSGVLPDVGVCEQAELKLAAWNIERFGQGGEHHHRDENEMREIVKILHKYDLIAITELMKEEELQKAQRLLSEMGREYDYLISPKVGWVGDDYQEHYAFLYYRGLVTVVPERETDEKKGSLYKKPIKKPESDELKKNFIRPPFWATFRAGKFDFSVVVVHTQPKRSEDECALMDEVYKKVQERNGPEEDVLLVGDFNLEPSASAFKGLLKSKDQDLSTMIFLFNEKNHRTMVSSNYLNDNIFFQRKHLSEYLHSGVDKFDKRDLGGVSKKDISDHRPVWAVFRIDIDDDGKKSGDDGNAENNDTGSDSGSVNDGDSEAPESDSQTSVDEIVYVTRSGTKYHKDGCSSLGQSKIEISLVAAKQKYGPCRKCSPPQ